MCKRFFPNVVPKAAERWSPRYLLPVHGRDEYLVIDTVESEECPASVCHRNPKIVQLVRDVGQALGVKEATGAIPFGQDSSKWPIRFFDAVRMFKSEEERIKKAHRDATSIASPNR